MFLLLFGLCSCHHMLGLDFGSQYLKFGFADPHSGETSVSSKCDRYGYPGAVAIKTPNNSDSPITNETLDKVTVLVGKKAVNYVRKHPKTGSEYILSSYTRNDTDFRTSTVLDQPSLLALYIANLYNNEVEPPYPSRILVALPFFFTTFVRNDLYTELAKFKLNFNSIVDDFQAIATLYANTYLTRYTNKARRVLFIDVGSNYAKTYSLNFTWEGNRTVASVDAADWSEKCGGFAFAKALAKKVRLPTHEAERMLKNVDNVSEFAMDEIKELQRIIRDTVFLGGLVDEVQMIGGLSNLKFIKDIVDDSVKDAFNLTVSEKPKKTAAKTNTTASENSANETSNQTVDQTINQTVNQNETAKETLHTSEADDDMAKTSTFVNATNTTNTEKPKVLHELDAKNAILLGTLQYGLQIEDKSNFNPTYIVRKPVASYYVKCGGSQDKYCQKNANCKLPVLFREKGCNESFEVFVDKRHVPTGTVETINYFKYTNLTSFVFNESKPCRGYIRFTTPDPFIEETIWCNDTRECYTASFDQVFPNFSEGADEKRFNLYDLLSSKTILKEKNAQLVSLIQRGLEDVKKAIYPPEGTEQTKKIDDKMRNAFDKLIKQSESGEFAKMTNYHLTLAFTEMKTLVKKLTAK